MKCEYCGISSGSSMFVKEGSSWGFLNCCLGPAIIMASQVLANLAVSWHYIKWRQLICVCSPVCRNVCLPERRPECTLWAVYSVFFKKNWHMFCAWTNVHVVGHSSFFSPHEHTCINFGDLRCSGWVLSWAHLLRFNFISSAFLSFYLLL